MFCLVKAMSDSSGSECFAKALLLCLCLEICHVLLGYFCVYISTAYHPL